MRGEAVPGMGSNVKTRKTTTQTNNTISTVAVDSVLTSDHMNSTPVGSMISSTSPQDNNIVSETESAIDSYRRFFDPNRFYGLTSFNEYFGKCDKFKTEEERVDDLNPIRMLVSVSFQKQVCNLSQRN